MLPLTHDVTLETEALAAVQAAVDNFGRLVIVVNNAGFSRFGPFEQMSPDEFGELVATCFYGVVYTARAVIPVMR